MKRNTTIKIDGGIAYIDLTLGQVAMIDVSDIDLIKDKTWRALEKRRKDGSLVNVYAVTSKSRKVIMMHRIIANPSIDFQVDHIDGNGLNNSRSNLRIATNRQNQYNRKNGANNTSGVKCVSWDKASCKWKTTIRANSKKIHIGYFEEIEAAELAYALAAEKYHGTFARLK